MPFTKREGGPGTVPAGLRAAGWAVLVAVGLAGWLLSMRLGEPARAWRALLVNSLFFTPLAAGLVVWSAVLQVSHGEWAGRLERLTRLGLAFAPVSLLALLVLWGFAGQWAPWKVGAQPVQGAWLHPDFLFARDVAALVVFWVVAAVYVSRRARGNCRRLAAWLIVTYAVTFSLLGFDLVMALDPTWYSTLMGGYFFMSGMYIAIAAWTLLSVHHPAGTADRLHDLGKLVVAFSMITTYLAYSQLLPIWYENLPHETRFELSRLRLGNWQWVAWGLLATVYMGPLVLLLTRWSKRTRWFLGAVAALILVGMWVERWWLVEPTFGPVAGLGMTEVTITAAFFGALAMALELGRRLVPPAPAEEEAD